MKNFIPNTKASLPAARVWSMLAIAASSLVTLSNESSAAQLVTAEVVALPTTSSSGIIGFTSVTSDQAGSWVSSALLASPTASTNSVFYGVLAGSGTSTPGILRTPQLINGYQQDWIFSPRVRGQDIAYSAVEPGNNFFSSWINDDLIAQVGDPIGNTGLEWAGSRPPIMTSTQRFFVVGNARPIGSQASPPQVVVRFPAETLVLQVGDVPAGLSGSITSIRSFESSPNGNFWVAIVTYVSSITGEEEMAVVETDNIHAYGPSFQRAKTENSGWTGFENAFVDDDRRVLLLGTDGSGPLLLREDRVLARGQFSELYDSDVEGFVLTDGPSQQGIAAEVNGLALDRLGANGVDANGDGVADPGWAIVGPTSSQDATFIGDDRVLVSVSLQVPGSGVLRALVRATLALPRNVVCDGVPNSTGYASSLRAIGVDRAAFNDLELLVTDLPGWTLLLPLMSRTSGFTPNPAGSVGNLCLGGAIGRGIPFSASSNATIRVFPQFLPQPNGFVAAQAGETWFFQVWHRDAVAGAATSNFSSAIGVTFQ